MNRNNMKHRAVQYYNENQVPQQLETLLNTMFLEEPLDIYGYMAQYFERLSKPASISEITVDRILSNSGFETLRTGISCIVNGVKKEILHLEFFKDNGSTTNLKAPLTASRSSAKQSSKKDTKSKGTNKKADHLQTPEVEHITAPLVPKCNFSIDSTTQLLTERFIPYLIGSSLTQKEVDEKLSECCIELKDQDEVGEETQVYVSTQSNIDSPTFPTQSQGGSKHFQEEKTRICMSSFYLSLMTSLARCQLQGQSIHRLEKSECSKRFPMPAISFFSCDNNTPGKLSMVKEFLVLPKPSLDLTKSVQDLVKLYRSFENVLFTKIAANGLIRNQRGTLTPNFDKLEQIFDFVFQACKSTFDLEFNEMFDIILNVGANEFFDYDKKKYDVCTGLSKTTDELISLYKGWIQSYPIIALIDPISPVDSHGMTTLYEKVSPQCFIITSQFSDFDHVVSLMEKESVDGILLQPELYCQTLSEVTSNLKRLKDLNGVLMMSDEWCTSQKTDVAVDIGIGFESTFLRLSSPVYGGASNLQQFLDIYAKEKNEWYTQNEEYEFRGKMKDCEVSENIEEDKQEQEQGER